MADSKFLPYQDANGDGLIDVCGEIAAPEELGCPECIPNAAAIVPNWLKRNRYEPFLNEKICKYQFTITTNETTTGYLEGIDESEAEAALNAIYREYEEPAIKALLLVYNKDSSETSMNAIKAVIEDTEYDLAVRPKSRLKLLYSVPKEDLEGLEDAEEDEESDEETGDITATFVAGEMGPMMMRLRKTLRLYNRYLKTYRAVDNSNLLFLEDNKEFPLQIYGDWGGGLAKTEVMSKVLPQLDGFLNTYGYNIANVGGLFNAGSGVWRRGDRLTEITFTFDSKYVIKKLKFYTEECGEKPIIFTRDGKIQKLMAESAWKDRTAMAYLVSLNEMDAEIRGRVAPNWVAFLKKYTYPEIYETDTVVYESKWGGSCVGEALYNESKQLGQDILDDVFSIGDAIAYKFNELQCKNSLGEAIELETEWGLIYDPERGENVNLVTMAKMQAHQEIEDQDMTFQSFCEAILAVGVATQASAMGAPSSITDELYKEALDDLKLCGLTALIAEVLQCLMGGMTLEETLAIAADKALRAMSINNFGDLFVGLPPDKQAELDALVQRKIESGEIFKDSSSLQAYSDGIASGTGEASATSGEASTRILWSKPWDNEELTAESRSTSSPTTSAVTTYSGESRTLVQQFDVGSEENRGQLDSNVVLEAYIQALLEGFQDDYMTLIDEINKFPGAQTIAWLIATVDCPRPPFFNPNVMDFIKDVELPFCRDMNDITFPKLVNPMDWFPGVVDITSIIKEAFMVALNELIVTIIMKLIAKICELIGNALCKALELGGNLVAAAVSPNDCTQLSDMFRESLCGDTVDDQVVNDTTVDMIASLGVGGAAFADQEQTLTFASDIGCSVTRKELAEAMLGQMSDDMADAMVSLIENEYPDYEEALPHAAAVKNFFEGMGNVLPTDFKEGLKDFVNELPDNDMMPAHPSLCATPAQIDDFCELRAALLADRASPEQIAQMCENIREGIKGDYEDIQRASQDWDNYVEENMPPIMSDPGCDNGLVPFEPAVAIAIATTALGNQIEQLKVDYGTDMLGNGPGDKNWGLINMIMSDTMGKPLTVHNRYVSRKDRVVDFYTGLFQDAEDTFLKGSIDTLMGGQLSSFVSGDPMPSKQRGAYPTSIGEYLRQDMLLKGSPPVGIASSINNDWQPDDDWHMDMDRLGFGSGLFGRDLDLLGIPDLGYNIVLESTFDEDEKASGVTFIEKGRKATSDLGVLEFRDNAKGLVATEESTWSYGFDMEVYFGDLVENDDGTTVNRPDDNVRIKITDYYNMAADMDDSVEALLDNTINPATNKPFLPKLTALADRIVPSLKYEFLAVDDTIMDAIMPSVNKMYDPSPADLGIPKGLNILDQYTAFLNTFESTSAYTPQTVLLHEMINDLNENAVSEVDVKNFRNGALEAASQMIFTDIAANTKSWAYGAEYDTLNTADIEYGIYDPESWNEDISDYSGWIPYSDYQVVGDDGDSRGLRNRDMMLGISFNQYWNEYVNETPDETRVFYLDPMTFGGNYMNPGLYIRPLKNEGWLGMVDVLFPELSPCKPQNTDLVDFGGIQEIVDEIYPSIPEDERLKSDPDCVVELPYNRILMRSAKAGLVGLITATCRIYASTHIIKALPAYTTFSPIIPDTFSSACASYVVENMETSFKDAGGGPAWAEGVFKDEEFWYAFLEQSVQLYSAMVDDGKVEAPPTVLEALFRINDMQEEYEYPYKEELKAARATREAGRFQTLKNYRQDKNLEAIRETEEDAKLVLKQWVVEALNFMSEGLMRNMKRLNLTPEFHNLSYYVMDKMCVGSTLELNSAVKPDGTFEASYVDLPVVPFDDLESEEVAYYTGGAELVVGEDLDEEGLSPGEEYIGYYHVELDEDGNPTWMAGEYHSDEDLHDALLPIVNQIIVEIGDVPEIGTATEGALSPTTLFAIEKYIYVEGHGRLTTTEAIEKVKAGDLTRNLSEVYPGSLKLVTDAHGNDVGLEGSLGVRYGLQFGVIVGSTNYEVTAVEVDALDLPLSEFATLAGNSKLLLCLLNLLKQDEKFKLVTRYVVPLNKLTAIAAIYTDMAMLPSIGELTVKTGQTFESWSPFFLPVPDTDDSDYGDGENKPGVVATVDVDFGTADEPVDPPVIGDVTTGPASAAVAGYWSSKKDRNVISLFWLEFDGWDQVLLRNSSGRIKNLFRSYYNSRDFDPDDIGKANKRGPGEIFFNRMRGLIKPAPGKRLLPFWRRRKLRSNPFNANGELCENED